MSLFLKIIAARVATITMLTFAGVSGLTFFVWPTFLGDQTLVVTPQTIQALTQLRAESKFVKDDSSFYFGAPNETVRLTAQGSVDGLLDDLLTELPKDPHRSMVLKKFKQAMEKFSISESEERDQFLMYLQRIMAVVGIHSSGELMNVWRYGFPYGWLV